MRGEEAHHRELPRTLQFHRRPRLIADALAAGLVVGVAAAMQGFRDHYVTPMRWGSLCVDSAPPLVCSVRGAVLWLQTVYAWGAAALYAGLLTLIGGNWSAVAAVGLGLVAVVNQNATWGVVGLVIGVLSWVRREGTGTRL